MRQNRMVLGAVLLLCSTALVSAQVPIVGGKGAHLRDIAGTDTLVTVVLKGSGATDSNLKIESVKGNLLTVISQTGELNHYLLSDVQEIRVQGSVLTVKRLDPLVDRGLTQEQQAVVHRAVERANEIFSTSNDNQPLKMWAAEVIAVGGSEGQKQDALEYLNKLAAGNDLRTALAAAWHLVLAGSPPSTSELVTQGLNSGDRKVRASAALLAGVTQDPSGKAQLYKMLRDRAADISVPAIQALAWLGDREIIPTLLSLITERNEEKAEAATRALIALGGDDVIEQMKLKLPNTDGLARFRVVRVLHGLGDPLGAQLMRDEMLNVPSLRFQTAIILAREGDLRAIQVLRERLAQKYDPFEEVLRHRAEATAALIDAGDRTNIGVFQELLRLELDAPQVDPAVLKRIKQIVLQLISQLDLHSLLPVTQPAIESTDSSIAMAGCRAAVGLSNPNYRARLERAIDT